MMDEIYDCMNLFVMMECKKIKNCRFGSLCRVLHSSKDLVAECHGHNTRQSWKNGRSENHFSSFAECHDHGPRQRFFLKKIQTLPSARQRTLGKEIFFKKKLNFAECREESTRQRNLKKNSNFAECRTEGTRQRIFFKKYSHFAERRPGGTRQRIFRKKK